MAVVLFVYVVISLIGSMFSDTGLFLALTLGPVIFPAWYHYNVWNRLEAFFHGPVERMTTTPSSPEGTASRHATGGSSSSSSILVIHPLLAERIVVPLQDLWSHVYAQYQEAIRLPDEFFLRTSSAGSAPLTSASSLFPPSIASAVSIATTINTTTSRPATSRPASLYQYATPERRPSISEAVDSLGFLGSPVSPPQQATPAASDAFSSSTSIFSPAYWMRAMPAKDPSPAIRDSKKKKTDDHDDHDDHDNDSPTRPYRIPEQAHKPMPTKSQPDSSSKSNPLLRQRSTNTTTTNNNNNNTAGDHVPPVKSRQSGSSTTAGDEESFEHVEKSDLD